ncbi:hypothetical protein MD484_g7328, partial [Candolleomyces efflorescens]
MLPLALPTTLPVHVNASFKMSSDRRQIRLDEYDNDDTRFNRWLLTNPLPSVYLALLEGIARSRDNSQWWPGARVRVGYTRDEDDAGQLTTVQEDSLTTALTKAFYSDHLPTSTRRAFRSMYKDDTFDLSTAVLFSHLAPIAVQKVCNTLRPSTLIKLGIEVTGKFRSDKVEVKTLDGKFVKRLLLADGGAETVRQRLDPAAVEELLAFVSEGEGNNLLGLPLLRLQDNTWTSLQNDGTSKHYYSLLTHEYVKNDLFPTNRFVHSQFFPSQALPGASRLLDTLLKSDVSVENLDSGAVKQLTEERLASILPEGKLDWILSFWRAHPFFPSEGLNKSMESLPLVPTSDPTTFKSLLQLKKSEALLIDSEVDCPEWLKSCMEDLGIPTVAVDTRNPPALRIVLRSSEYMASESFFDRFLACLRPIVGAAIQKLGSWPVARQSTFAEWVRSKIESGMEEGMQHVARKLPVWRARRGEEETLCAANNISLLPQRLPLGVGCFSTTFRTVDNAVLHLGIERQAIRQLHKQLRIPNVLEEGEMEEMYKILVRYYLNSEYIEYFLMPNAGRRMVDCEELYPRTDFFRAAFGESSPRFLLQSFANFEGEINHMGLQREQKVGLSSFRNCAQAFYNDPSPVAEKMGRAQIVYQFYCERLPVQVPSGHGAQWHILDGIRFIPRDPSPVRQLGRSSEIELPQRIRDLPSIVSPREVVQRKYFDIAWTQRVALETEPEDRLLVAFPDFGRPTGPEVIAHLKALCQLPRGTIVLHDLKATYQWLSEQPPAVTSSIAGLKEEPIFLNVDDPDVDEWRWSSASQLAFETEDLTSVQGVRQFLLPFRPFLKSVGVLEAYYPEIEADSEHSGALYEQKQFQSFREKLDEQRLSGKFTDVLFVPRRAVKGRTPDTHHELDHPTLRGHRSYLAGCVPWFEDMFLGGFREGSGGGSADGVAGSVGDDDDDSDLDDEDVPESVESLSGEGSSTTNMLVVPLPSSRHVIKALLNYLYTGQLIIDEGDRALKDFLGTLKLAHFLDMRALFDLCQREIVRRRLINPETLDIVRQSIQALDANIIKKWPLPPQPLQPIENVHKARKEKRRRPQPPPPPPVEDDRDDASGSSSGGGGGSIMRRMSSMFRPKRKPLPPPSNLNFSAAQSGSVSSRSHNAIGYMYMAPDLYRSPGGSVESETYDESEDDIRRPSGLGSAVSLTLPPSPSLLIQPDVEKVANPSDVSSDGVYNRSRAISSPNLLRSLSQKAKNKLRRRSVSGRKSVAQNPVVPEMPPPPPPPVLAKPTRSFEFPAEVLDLVFSHLPRKTIVSLCPLSRAFCSSGRVNLYHKLELDTLSPLRLQKLLALLASRNDLTDLVQECVCRTWPSFLSPPSPPRPNRDDADDDEDEPVYGFEDPRREEDELKDRLLAATFTLALQRMSNLVKLTLPNFDRSLLAQHTAFGLRSLTFMCSKMTGEEMSVLFTWLDGQINVVELTFPVLEDTTTTDAQHNPPQDATPIHQHQARNSINLLQVPTANGPINRATTPLSPYFESRPLSPVNPAVRQSLLGSPTLLPSLTTLHATPAILALLQPSSTLLPPAGSSATSSAVSLSNSDTSLSTRRLQNVYLNISTTLYTGLRPNTVMASLRGTVTKLGVRFGESVDKRTVEKVLGAVAAILGSRSAAGASNGNGNGGGTEDRATWRGLEELEVSFKAKSALMPGMEETLYKTLQTTLPRYTHLHKLSLNFPSSSNPPKGSARSSFVLTPPTAPPMELEVALKGDTVFRFPAPPPSPLPSPTAVPGLGAAQQQARYSHLKSSYPIQPISDGTSTAVYPSFDTIRGTSTTKRMSLFNATDMGAGRDMGEAMSQFEGDRFAWWGGLGRSSGRASSSNNDSRVARCTCLTLSSDIFLLFVICFRHRSPKCSYEPSFDVWVSKTFSISQDHIIPFPLIFISACITLDEATSTSVLAPPGFRQLPCPTIAEHKTSTYKHEIISSTPFASLIPTPPSPASPSDFANAERGPPNSESALDTWVEHGRQQQQQQHYERQ